MNKKEDRLIRSIFKQLRDEETQLTPSFNQTLQKRKVTRSKTSPWLVYWLRPVAVTLLLVIIAIPIVYNSLLDPETSDLEFTSDFEEWEAPTDFLLSFNDQPYIDGLPSIGSTFWAVEGNQETDN